MFRSSNNKRCLSLLSALTAALLWLAPARSGSAAAYTYNARQRTINAGVLFVGSASDAAFSSVNTPNPVPDPAPFVFYVLNQRPDVKPVGWSFVNPLAQSTVSTAMSTRWGGAYSVGASLGPSQASYWEVALRDVSADDLQQFDVLYLVGSYVVGTTPVLVTFTPADNEKLRRFVDNGGQLIVEYGVGTPAQPHLFGALPLFTGASWLTGTDSTLTPPFVAGLPDLHPILVQPTFLQPGDLSFLGQASPSNTYGTITPLANTDYNNLFSTVLSHSGGAAMTAAQLGGGQVVVDTLNIGPAVSLFSGAILPLNFNPAAAPAADLKYLSNVISWADTHPTENKTSHQNAAGPSSASFAAAWAYPVANSSASTPAPPGAAVYGNLVYVTDSAGILHAFDAIPDELLTSQTVNPTPGDDGIADFGSATAPSQYDEIWNASVGANASAPTVASYGGATYVFVETANGSVLQFSDLNTTANVAPVKTYTAPAAAAFSGHAPAPTYYDGRIYAGEPDGTMFVVGLSGGSASNGVIVPVDPTALGVSSASATASPAVSLLGSGPVSNSIVALVPTTQDMNVVLLGARNDPLALYSPNGQFQGFNVNRLARYSLFNLFVDATPGLVPTGRAYDSDGLNGVPLSGSRDPVFASTNFPANVDDFFGDWDADFVQSVTQGGNPQAGLTLHEIKALSLSNTAGGTATLSAPAIDRHGDYYYTVYDGTNSYLFGLHDDIAQRNVRIKFRFRLPRTADPSTVNPTGAANWGSVPGTAVDADNVHYDDTTLNSNGATNSLMDYHFVGAPVVDGQGNVYVAAQNGTTGPAAVLAFSADQEVTAMPPGGAASGFDATQARYFQTDESAGNPQNPLVAIPNPGRGAGRYGQITTAGSLASVFNFGRGSGGSRQIAGNLCEPQPFTATPSGPNGGSATWMYFHTNLSWYATFAVSGQISGLSKSGSTLLLCDSGGAYNTLYKLPAAPTIGAGKLAALPIRKAPLGTGAGGTPLSIGTVIAAPSAGGGAMVINGSTGLAAFNQQLTLIADNNRILEVDADGNAVWSADATTRVGPNGASTKVDFAHPSALSQFAPNDYLVADTGNNRCVRFDRGGGVTWELTRFYDPNALMAPGQPFTLSQPTSVEVRTEYDSTTYKDPVSQNPITVQFVHYLVSDTGNDRIVEITDTLDAAGNILYFDTNTPAKVVLPGAPGSVTHDHLLTWVTHTGDKSGRHYQFAGASYLDIPGATANAVHSIEVFALVTNTRLAQPIGGQLAAASADAPGGSIVAFNRPPNPLSYANITSATPSDLAFVATSYTANTAAGTQTFPVRNPRFLHVFAPPQGLPANAAAYAYSFLYADSNGAFDLVYTGLTTPPVSYGLAFTQANYRAMTVATNTPPLTATPTLDRSTIPFVPTCVQRLNDDATNRPGINHIERYLITQSYSQGELARLPNSPATIPYRLGGEVFEVDVSTNAGNAVTIDPVGGFAGAVTLSRPVGAGTLTQPTFALRTTQ